MWIHHWVSSSGQRRVQTGVFLLTIFLILGLLWTGASVSHYREAVANLYRFETESSSRNVFNFIKRDVRLASQMHSTWDSLPATQVTNDTLVIRFSELDEVLYFLDGEEKLYRSDAVIASNVLGFTLDSIQDGFKISLTVAATETSKIVNNGDRYHKTYEWVVIPHKFYQGGN